MQKENSCTVGQWCDRWFCENQSRWGGSTVGGYRNLIYRHILPGIGSIPLVELSENTVILGETSVGEWLSFIPGCLIFTGISKIGRAHV